LAFSGEAAGFLSIIEMRLLLRVSKDRELAKRRGDAGDINPPLQAAEFAYQYWGRIKDLSLADNAKFRTLTAANESQTPEQIDRETLRIWVGTRTVVSSDSSSWAGTGHSSCLNLRSAHHLFLPAYASQPR
jgi:hypothetical protein